MYIIVAVVCIAAFVTIVLCAMDEPKYPVKCYRCRYSVRSKKHPFKYICNKYIYLMDSFDYCSEGEEEDRYKILK